MTTNHTEDMGVLTVRETAKLLRISESSARSLIRDGTIPSWRPGRAGQAGWRTIRVPLRGLQEMVSAQTSNEKGGKAA
jgi:excisionase family DNA binding protein